MSVLILPHRWRRQPTGPVEVDWESPLGEFIDFVAYPSLGALVGRNGSRNRLEAQTNGIIKPGGDWLGYAANGGTSDGWATASTFDAIDGAAALSGFALLSLSSVTGVVAAKWNDTGNKYAWIWATDSSQFAPIICGNGADVVANSTSVRTSNATTGVVTTGFSWSASTSVIPYFAGRQSVGSTWFNNPPASIFTTSEKLWLDRHATAGTGSGNTNVGLLLIGNGKKWPDAVHQALHENPWQAFRPLQRRIYVPSAATGGGTSVNLSGLEATGAVGSLAQAHALALTGQAATGAVGTLTPALSVALSGLATAGAVGNLAQSHAITLSGLAATGAVGTFTASHTVALSGLAVTGAVGTLTPLSGFNVLLSGQEATGAVGAFSLSQAKALSGLEATGAVGLLSPVSGITVALTGLPATGAVGSLTSAVSVALSGLEVTGAIGSFGLSTPTDVDLTGLEANAALGLLTPSSYAITTVRPDADDSAGAWLPSAGSDLYAMIDEAVTDDGDYIYTESASTCRLSLGAMTDPGVNYAHRITYRVKGNGSVTITVRLGATSTTVATWTHAPAPSSLTTYTQTLDSGEVDTFRANSGYSSGWIEFEAT